MNAEAAKIQAWRGVVVVRHFVALRDESDAPAGYSALEHRRCWRSFTVTRQQSLAAMQAAARKS
ncbi:hypothetical protein V2I52_07355 [Brenneria sp. g21c3]|uniref:hypothetical protein n=1 Tax=Brenneria sp. g21c3 TaxID=3093893 RepID=UPI002EBE13EB|nr:hypothetical protein [Brenneria sp. g21c3]